jgi:hypothetical protein
MSPLIVKIKYFCFLGLEKTRQTKKVINELYDKNGKSTTDQNEIMEIEVDYYKKEILDHFFLKIKDMAPIFCEFDKCPLS